MKRVKVLLLLIMTLVTGVISSQTVKPINAEILPNTALQEETPEYKKYTLLIEKLNEGEKTLENLDKSEIRLMKKHDPHYPDGYNEFPFNWSILGPGCSWYCGAQYETKVSSSLEAQGNNLYSEKSVGDDDVRTAWVEGAEGYGIGEYVEFIFDYNAPRATSVTISNGYNKSATAWKSNSRVKTLNIYEDDKLLMTVNLADTRDLQQFDLPHPIPNRKEESRMSDRDENKPPVRLRMMISEVYKGDKYDDTAISEILFDGMDVHCLLEGTMITMADRKEQAIENVKVGQKVLAWNPVKKKMEKQEVVRIHTAQHSASEMISIHYKLNKKMTLSLTADHPVYSITGWVSANPEATTNYQRYTGVKVGKLDANTILYRASEDGRSLIKKRINSIESFESKNDAILNTYTLELDGNGIFFANGFAVGQE